MGLVYTAAQAKQADRFIIERLGLPGLVLMENAARGVFDAVVELLAETNRAVQDARVAVVCGAGQNGGDGFAVARHLVVAGARVDVHLCMPPGKITGDAAVNLRVLQAMPQVPVHDRSAVFEAASWRGALEGAHVVVDAIFGTGLKSTVTGVPAAAIQAINELSSEVGRVAIDLPSGLDADSGAVRGVAVAADVTATMAAPKLGLVLDAVAPVGTLRVIPLGAVAPALPEDGPYVHTIDDALVRSWLPRHTHVAHKGTRGHVLLIAGSEGKTGAAALSGRAAMRAGAGLVTIAATRAAQAALDAKLWEVMSLSYTSGDDADEASLGVCTSFAQRCKAVAMGPGMPTGSRTRDMVRALATELDLPMVIDADGLNHLGTDVGLLKNAAGARVLTPHPGEMARLLDCSIADVQADRLGCGRKLAAMTGAVAVLKGARTLVAQPDGTVFVNLAASASLGTAGSGDVLTGVIAALLAQGAPALAAAVCGVFVHGIAALRACSDHGFSTLVAGDLPDAVAKVLRSFE